MYWSTCCIHTFLILTRSSMTQPVFASVLFFPIFEFYYRVDLHQWPHFIFSPQFLFIFSMGLIFNFLKHRWPRTKSFLTISWFKYWIACNILRESSAGFRRWSFWQTIHFLFPLLSTIARWYFLSQNYACFPFFSFSWRLSKNFCSFVFSIKSWTKLNNLWRNNTNNPVDNIRTYLLILSQLPHSVTLCFHHFNSTCICFFRVLTLCKCGSLHG